VIAELWSLANTSPQ